MRKGNTERRRPLFAFPADALFLSPQSKMPLAASSSRISSPAGKVAGAAHLGAFRQQCINLLVGQRIGLQKLAGGLIVSGALLTAPIPGPIEKISASRSSRTEKSRRSGAGFPEWPAHCLREESPSRRRSYPREPARRWRPAPRRCSGRRRARLCEKFSCARAASLLSSAFSPAGKLPLRMRLTKVRRRSTALPESIRPSMVKFRGWR